MPGDVRKMTEASETSTGFPSSLVPFSREAHPFGGYGSDVHLAALVMYCLGWRKQDVAEVLGVSWHAVEEWSSTKGARLAKFVEPGPDGSGTWAVFRERLRPLIASGMLGRPEVRQKERTIGELALDVDRVLDDVIQRFGEMVEQGGAKVSPTHIAELARVKMMVEQYRQREREMLADVQREVAGIVKELVKDPLLRREIARRFEVQAGELVRKYIPLGEGQAA